ncbi:MAG: DUF433 domain-containing protein [Chloroflexota bacterium]|nr:DUF433 domain-containing protein [Chloroflexota bacterium]
MAFAVVTDPIPLHMNRDGVMLVGGTRVTLDTVVGAFTDGATPEEIVQQYPSLDLADIYAVLGYYLRHRAEVDAYLHRRQQQAEQVRQQNEARFPMAGIRERLLARRHAKDEP